MPIKIIADYRELLIDIFFAIIIVVGFDRFMREFLPDHMKEISTPPIMLDTLFFFAAYFWVVTHWVSYHELITKYPYYRWRKFFVDILLFSIMFIVINMSFEADQNKFGLLLVWLLIIWQIFACLWHLSDKGLRPLKLYLKLHSWRIITYGTLLFFLYDPLHISSPTFALFALEVTDELSLPLGGAVYSSYHYSVMVTVILAMILWSTDRLRRFTRKDSRYYLCKYSGGFSEINVRKDGQLELIRYPIRKKIGNKGKDIVKFESDPSPQGRFYKLLRRKSYVNNCLPRLMITIFPEDINRVYVERTMDQQDGSNDLRLKIECKKIEYKLCNSDKTIEDITILFDLSDEIIANVKEGISELSERNKHGDLSPL
jgi:hypothetical protein